VLRLGIECSDGAKATTFDAHRFFMTDERPSGPVLIQRGGSGGMRTWELGFWVWPLPPPGAFAFVSEWPAEGIALTRREIDADLIRQSAASAEELWSNAGTQPGSGWVSSSRTG
jgi:hypothetical protein